MAAPRRRCARVQPWRRRCWLGRDHGGHRQGGGEDTRNHRRTDAGNRRLLAVHRVVHALGRAARRRGRRGVDARVRPLPPSAARCGGCVVAGLLTGCAVLVKQSAFDAGAAAAVYLVWTRRRAGLAPAAALVAAAFVPVVVAALSAPNFHDWWYAMVTYRDQADSILTGSLTARLDVAWHSLGAGRSAGLGVLALRGRDGLAAMAAARGAVAGLRDPRRDRRRQLPQPLLPADGAAARAAGRDRRRRAVAAAEPAGDRRSCAAAVAATAVVTVPLWFDSPNAQARDVFPATRTCAPTPPSCATSAPTPTRTSASS